MILVLFSSCNRNPGSTVSWSPVVDSLLHDSVKVNGIVDSLKKAAVKVSTDTVAIRLVNEIAAIWKGKPNLILSEAARSKSQEIGYRTGAADAACKMGMAYCRKGNYRVADSLFDIALSESKAIADQKLIAQALFWKSEVPRMQADNKKALEYLDQSIAVAKACGDTSRVAYCLSAKGSAYFIERDFDKARMLTDSALRLAKDKYLVCMCYNSIGEILRFQSRDQEALKSYEKSLEIAVALNDKSRMAASYTTIGEVYRLEDNYSLALENEQKGLQMAREVNDLNRVSFCLMGIGDIYRQQKEYTQAIGFYTESVKIAREINNKINLGFSLNAMGEVYYFLDDFEKSQQCYEEAISVATEQNDKSRIAFCKNAIAELHRAKKEYEQARALYLESLEIGKEIEDHNLLAYTCYSIGELDFRMGDYSNAADFGRQSMTEARLSQIPANIENSAKLLFEAYEKLGRSAPALEMHKLYMQMKDSISNTVQVKKFAAVEYQVKEERLKADQALREKEFLAERTLKEEELKRQKLLRNGFIGGFLLFGLLAFVIYRSLQQNRKAKKLIEEQKHLVEEKQKEILDSIHYAQRIQRALITNEKYVDRNLRRLNDPSRPA